MNDLKTLLSELTHKLQAKHMTIVTAESCTGGLVASFLTEQPGSSAWFERGFVTYSNLAKHEMLGVDLNLIKAHGAVSRIVAEAMVEGALEHSAADVALAVTGIAGPTGGSLKKPVGTVYFAFALRNQQPRSEHHYFSSKGREDIRLLSCRQAFLGVLALLAN
ncbi:Competence-damage inducible protein CinA [Legionella beliardensis]|uniref:Competence-damage inducible protein CinA n=1 Tax=Legionella beliardensis TaxID=91822 RepID=A0A378I3R7_9GAMM|nr:CinA family protein [Legionella beliardensis]STX29502.1 Competence-damage inducible protein CinA [Legionella beliardensis]